MALTFSGCASSGEQRDSDPLELINRPIFYANAAADWAVLSPAASLYQASVPALARSAIHNAIVNLDAPLILANDILQGRICAATDTSARFAINSTVGIAGLFDVAADNGIPGHVNDLATTLASYGVPSGPYVMVPLLGPSDLRGAVATTATFVADPMDLALSSFAATAVTWGRTAAALLDDRAAENAADIEWIEHAVDPYEAAHMLYLRDQLRGAPVPGCFLLAEVTYK